MQQQPAGDATVVGGVLASVTALVKKQGDTMIRHRTDIAAALPTLRRGDSASGVKMVAPKQLIGPVDKAQ